VAQLDEARQGAVTQVADVAVAPDKKSFPPRSFIVILVTLIAFVTAVLWAVARDRWERELRYQGKQSRIATLRELMFHKS
jgi:uncharacterized protein involved in exopolysaccharide biosynthesis